MTLVLDAGALIAVDRGDRRIVALLLAAHRAGTSPVTHGDIVGQVWRGGPRPARLARMLSGVHVIPLDVELGRRAGALLGEARTSDVLDAAVALPAGDGDEILTSDVEDLLSLCVLTGAHVELVPV